MRSEAKTSHGNHPLLPSHSGNAEVDRQAGETMNTVNSQDFCKYTTIYIFFMFFLVKYTFFLLLFVNKTLFFSIFNNNSVCVCVHGLPRSIGAVQMLLSFLTFGFTVSGFSQSPTVTQDVTTTLALGLKRGTSLLNILFGGEPSFHDTILGSSIHDTIRVSLHNGMIRLSLFVETDALQLSLQIQFFALESGSFNIRQRVVGQTKRAMEETSDFLLGFSSRARVPTTALF